MTSVRPFSYATHHYSSSGVAEAMTPARPGPVSPSLVSRTVRCARALAALCVPVAPVAVAQGQTFQSPMAPASTIGPVTDASTLSVLGLASLPNGSQLTGQNELWFGATQRLANLGPVRLSAVASGNWRVSDAVGANNAVEGTVALRARARLGLVRAWSAISYGRASLDGASGIGLLPGPTLTNIGADATRADTSVSNRVDLGSLGRAEAGLLTNLSGVELSFGVSVERATRVTTQTLDIRIADGLPPNTPSSSRETLVRTTRGVQRREYASGIAAMGFSTGSASWLVSVTAPVATWASEDAVSARPHPRPTVASVAVVQPLAAWFSVVGAASTNSTSLNQTIIRDDLGAQRKSFAPIVALGLRISRLPGRDGSEETPNGILAFETHTVGSVDSIAVSGINESASTDVDTLRVLLLIDAPRAEQVEFMGDATQWVVTQMHRTRNGRWRAELKLSPGVHRITVRADGGKWHAPPGISIGNDDYGSPVGIFMVPGKPQL